jgi:hypothetical protein
VDRRVSTVALLGFAIALASAPARGATITIVDSESGVVPIAVFDPGLGLLDEVALRIELHAGTTQITGGGGSGGPLPSHAHVLSIVFAPHNGLALPDLVFSTENAGGGGTTGVPAHSHAFASQARTLTFRDADLAPFLAASDYEIDYQAELSAVGSPSHTHALDTLDWTVETTFTFVPEPSSGLLLACGLAGWVGRRRQTA